ncbi:hypothetical protein TTRE_0000858201 [Trichuris trichiura]|uniref:Uncharacterized protein n=1 Tax=Trichuris trichiura TaxID=36087 RepID=A0A077ZKK8_TRITR|nr:hypothetical protein TTRE_0000858201 [Trichuris trichiura]
MGWHPVEEDQHLSRNLPELAAAGITMPQEAPVNCPLCSRQGRLTRLILCKISLEIAILCCPETDCIYPFNLQREQFQLHFLSVDGPSLLREDFLEEFAYVDDPEGFHEVEISRGLSEEIRSRCLPIGGGPMASVDVFRKRLGENMRELKRRLDAYQVFYPDKDELPSSDESAASPPMIYCTECAERGVQSKLILARVSFRRGLLICPVGECSFPLDQGPDVLSRLCVRTEVPRSTSIEFRKVNEAIDRLCLFIDEALEAEESSNSDASESEIPENRLIHSENHSPTELENSTGVVSEGRMPSVLMDDENCIPLPLENSNPVVIPVDVENIVQYEGKNDAVLSMEDEDMSKHNEGDQSDGVECEPSIDESAQNESTLSAEVEIEKCDEDIENPQIKSGESAATAIESEDVVVTFTQNECLVDIPSQVNASTCLQPENVDQVTTSSVLEDEIAAAIEEMYNAHSPIENEHQISELVANDIPSVESSAHMLPREEIPAAAPVEPEAIVPESKEVEETSAEVVIGVSNVAVSNKVNHCNSSAVNDGTECAALPTRSRPYKLRVDKSERIKPKSMEPENRSRVTALRKGTSASMSHSKVDAESASGRPQRSRRAPMRFDDYLWDDSELLSSIEGRPDYAVENSSEMTGRGRRKLNKDNVGGNCLKRVEKPKCNWSRRAKRASEEGNVVVTAELHQCTSFSEVENTQPNGQSNADIPNDRSSLTDPFHVGGYIRGRAMSMPSNDLGFSSLEEPPSKDSAEKEEGIPGRPPEKVRLISNGTRAVSATQAEAPQKKSFFARIKKQLMNACAEAAAERKVQAGVPSQEKNQLGDEMFDDAEMLSFHSFETGTSDASTALKPSGDALLGQQLREASIQMKNGQSSSANATTELLSFEELDFSAFDDLYGFPEPSVVDDNLII